MVSYLDIIKSTRKKPQQRTKDYSIYKSHTSDVHCNVLIPSVVYFTTDQK